MFKDKIQKINKLRNDKKKEQLNERGPKLDKKTKLNQMLRDKIKKNTKKRLKEWGSELKK